MRENGAAELCSDPPTPPETGFARPAPIYSSTQRQKDTNYFSGLIFFGASFFFRTLVISGLGQKMSTLGQNLSTTEGREDCQLASNWLVNIMYREYEVI